MSAQVPITTRTREERAHRGTALILAALLAQPEVEVVVKASRLRRYAVQDDVRVPSAKSPKLPLCILDGRQSFDAPALHAGSLARASEQLSRAHAAHALHGTKKLPSYDDVEGASLEQPCAVLIDIQLCDVEPIVT